MLSSKEILIQTMNKKAVTLTELLVISVIIAIVVGLAIPAFSTLTDKHRKQEGEAALRMLAAAETIYYARNDDVYYFPAGSDDLDEINTGMGLRIPYSSYWTYSISGSGATVNLRASHDATRYGTMQLNNGESPDTVTIVWHW